MFQPFPKFYIIRPDGSLTPLVPVDELPKWVSFANWDPEDIGMYSNMWAASLNSIPREGEYDVVCHHCFAQVDGHHRSVSEQSDISAPAPTPVLTYGDAIGTPGSCVMQAPDPASSQITAVPFLPAFIKQPPFHANLYSPFVGMCFVKFPRFRWPFGLGSATQDQDQDQDQDGTEEEENEERCGREQSKPLTPNPDDESDSSSEYPAQTPLLKALERRVSESNRAHNSRGSSSGADLELGYGPYGSLYPRSQLADDASGPPSESFLSAEEPLHIGPRRQKSTDEVPYKKSALAHKASASRRGTKQVRFDWTGANSTSSK